MKPGRLTSNKLTPRETRLLRIALLILFVYIIPFELAPTVLEQHQNVQQENLEVERKISKLTRLQGRKLLWMERRNEATSTQQSIEKALLKGSNPQLVGADLQGIVRALAEKSQLNIQSMELPEFSSVSGWLFSTQSIRFKATPRNLLLFLEQVENDTHRLETVSISTNTARKELTGTLSITGFSKEEP